MKKLIASAGLLALLVGNVAAQDNTPSQGVQGEKGAQMRERHHDLTSEIPDLSEEQKSKIKAIKEENRKQMEPQRAEMKVIRAKLMELKSAENPNTAEINKAIDRSAMLKAEMEKSRTASELKVRSILTPEQRKVMDQKMKEKQDLHQKQHMEKREMRKAK
jgi:Spy/CpxP family protein refolding chaperone